MEFVQPIRNRKQVESIKKVLLGQNERDYVLFTLGINSGLRISDLLPLKPADIISDRIRLREKKTGKAINFPLSPQVAKILRDYIGRNAGSEYLFGSRKGGEPITRQQAYRIINEAARAVGITDKIGTHTLRKTFAYHALKGGASITTVQKLLNHSSPGITMAYAGITQDDLDSVYLSLNL